MDTFPPILRDFPHQFETERLLIRLPLPGDGVYVNEAIHESLDHLKPWMLWAQNPPTIEETEINVRQAHCHFLERVDLRFHLFEKKTKRFIGSSGLHQIDWNIPKFEIGYWCRVSESGKGYITEAVRGLTVFAFEILGAKRVEIRCDERNIRSRKVAERLGYRLEGVLRNHRLAVDDRLENTCVYAMTPDDFRFQSSRQRVSASQ
ncbi:GNAT family N-acetyltransferase [Thermoflavimicrobium dichotomicum]|uniref:Protein N-acetyltransferase, RimJ/RimL family n=1 Tax=Thermoflavimicrobium dichotomicum TaxID=46223 RepID=A0A1I3NGS3_9BACL|nr:GNAT family protein [Thermoflavimicrobium dichotomicum]SFJ08372.1 Protein N-acetyltransferase, RimJ/RimL family [Thermoflavimicrobium dichotomicum]